MIQQPERLLTRTQAADRLGLSERTIDLLRQKGELPTLKYGAAIRIPSSAVDGYIAKMYDGGE